MISFFHVLNVTDFFSLDDNGLTTNPLLTPVSSPDLEYSDRSSRVH